MSVKERLDDARALYANGRRTGALLMVLVAVAATSRKRYPKGSMGDREAFTTFVSEEMRTIAGVASFDLKCRGGRMPLQDILYGFVRCELAHEGELPDDIGFSEDKDIRVTVTDDKIMLSDGLLDGLARAVEQAVENADLF